MATAPLTHRRRRRRRPTEIAACDDQYPYMTQPIKLIIEEPTPGSFVWRLLETDTEGGHARILRSAEDEADSYELSLASGQRAHDTEIRRRAPA